MSWILVQRRDERLLLRCGCLRPSADRPRRRGCRYSAANEKKLLWTIVVVLLPVLGLILWYFLGPRGGRA